MYNVAAVMNDSVAVAEIKRFQATMEADPVVGRLMEAAETVEDMYKVAKRYIQIKFEDFHQIFNEAMDYFKGSKVELDDEVMECVVGGRWKGWKIFKKIAMVAVAAAIAVGVVAAAAVTGGVACGLVGAAGAFVHGFVTGSAITVGAALTSTAAVGGAVGGAVAGAALGITSMCK